MAEVVGIAASIIQIAGAGVKLSTALYTYVGSAARADQDITDIAGDVALTANVLDCVGSVFKEDDAKCLISKAAVRDATSIIQRCEDVFKEIDHLIEKRRKVTKDGKKTTSAFGKLMWPMKEQRVELLRRRLDSLKTSLLVLLEVLRFAGERARGKLEQSAIEKEREKIRQLHQRQQESLKNLQALESKLSGVSLNENDDDDDSTLQGSVPPSRAPTVAFMLAQTDAGREGKEKEGHPKTKQDSQAVMSPDEWSSSDDDTAGEDSGNEVAHVSVEDLVKCTRHVQSLLKRINSLQHAFEESQPQTIRHSRKLHKLYMRFCQKFESDVLKRKVNTTPRPLPRFSLPSAQDWYHNLSLPSLAELRPRPRSLKLEQAQAPLSANISPKQTPLHGDRANIGQHAQDSDRESQGTYAGPIAHPRQLAPYSEHLTKYQPNTLSIPPPPPGPPPLLKAGKHSIFTPIDERRSMLSVNWGNSSSVEQQPRSEGDFQVENNASTNESLAADWSEVEDPNERRKIQNKLAQRRFRDKVKEQKEETERGMEDQKRAGSAYASPEPEDLDSRRELSGLPWGVFRPPVQTEQQNPFPETVPGLVGPSKRILWSASVDSSFWHEGSGEGSQEPAAKGTPLTNSAWLQCTHCARWFNSAENLEEHTLSHMTTEPHSRRVWKSTDHQSPLLQKLRAKRPVPRRPRACTNCRKTMRVCDRNFPCSYCTSQGLECNAPSVREEANRNTRNSPNPVPTAASSESYKQDYQMQLMLLEQSSKRRLLLARQEQDHTAQGSYGQSFGGGSNPTEMSGTLPEINAMGIVNIIPAAVLQGEGDTQERGALYPEGPPQKGVTIGGAERLSSPQENWSSGATLGRAHSSAASVSDSRSRGDEPRRQKNPKSDVVIENPQRPMSFFGPAVTPPYSYAYSRTGADNGITDRRKFPVNQPPQDKFAEWGWITATPPTVDPALIGWQSNTESANMGFRAKGRTKGLDPEQRRESALLRLSGSCSNCRLRKEKCDLDTPCRACVQHYGDDLVNHPCTRFSEKNILKGDKPLSSFLGNVSVIPQPAQVDAGTDAISAKDDTVEHPGDGQKFDFDELANQRLEALRVQNQGQQVVPASNNPSAALGSSIQSLQQGQIGQSLHQPPSIPVALAPPDPSMYHTPQSNSPATVHSPLNNQHGRPIYGLPDQMQQMQRRQQSLQYGSFSSSQQNPLALHSSPPQPHHPQLVAYSAHGPQAPQASAQAMSDFSSVAQAQAQAMAQAHAQAQAVAIQQQMQQQQTQAQAQAQMPARPSAPGDNQMHAEHYHLPSLMDSPKRRGDHLEPIAHEPKQPEPTVKEIEGIGVKLSLSVYKQDAPYCKMEVDHDNYNTDTAIGHSLRDPESVHSASPREESDTVYKKKPRRGRLPGLQRNFTPQDDQLLIDLKENKRLRWDQILDFFPGRTTGELIWRWSRELRKSRRHDEGSMANLQQESHLVATTGVSTKPVEQSGNETHDDHLLPSPIQFDWDTPQRFSITTTGSMPAPNPFRSSFAHSHFSGDLESIVDTPAKRSNPAPVFSSVNNPNSQLHLVRGLPYDEDGAILPSRRMSSGDEETKRKRKKRKVRADGDEDTYDGDLELVSPVESSEQPTQFVTSSSPKILGRLRHVTPQSAQQEQSSLSIYFHHWVPPTSSQEKSSSGNSPATPSGKDKASSAFSSRLRTSSHASEPDYATSPKKRKAQDGHQAAPPPSTAHQYHSPSFSHISSFPKTSGRRRRVATPTASNSPTSTSTLTSTLDDNVPARPPPAKKVKMSMFSPIADADRSPPILIPCGACQNKGLRCDRDETAVPCSRCKSGGEECRMRRPRLKMRIETDEADDVEEERDDQEEERDIVDVLLDMWTVPVASYPVDPAALWVM
jgi:hypothetical protein